jgi:hypothetical protein
MAWVQVGAGSVTSNSSASDALTGVAAGSLVIVAFRYYRPSATAPTATIGGVSATLDEVVVDGPSTTGWCTGVFSLVSTAGGSVTCTVDSNNGSVDSMAVVAGEISTESVVDVVSDNSKTETSDSPPDTNAATATASGTAVAVWFAANDSLTEGNGFTNRYASTGGNYLGVSTLASSAGSVEWVSGRTTSFSWAAALVVYKAAAPTATAARLTFTHA